MFYKISVVKYLFSWNFSVGYFCQRTNYCYCSLCTWKNNRTAKCILVQINPLLTHLFPMHPFSIPWKHRKTVRSGGREKLHWEQMGEWSTFNSKYSDRVKWFIWQHWQKSMKREIIKNTLKAELKTLQNDKRRSSWVRLIFTYCSSEVVIWETSCTMEWLWSFQSKLIFVIWTLTILH